MYDKELADKITREGRKNIVDIIVSINKRVPKEGEITKLPIKRIK